MKKLITALICFLSLTTLSAYADDAPTPPVLTLNTTAFLDQGAIPVLYTCDGKDISPELDWVNLPAKTQSLAIVMSDPEAPGGTFYHWLVYNIPKSVTTLTEGQDKLPAGAMIGKNDFGKKQYNGPCPPKGSVHTYIITLYALDSNLSLTAGADGKTVMEAVKKHTAGKIDLTAVYSRWIK